MDLHTANGTKVDAIPLLPFVPRRLTSECKVTCGASTRTYRFSVDTDAYSRKKESLYSKIANYESNNEESKENTVFVGGNVYLLMF